MPASFANILRLTALILIVLGTAAILLLDRFIDSHQQQTIRTLNLADRQRFLSQRVAGLALELATHANVPRPALSDDAPIDQQDKDQIQADVRDQLRQSIALMQASHLALVSGASETGALLPADAALNEIYFDNPYDLDHTMVAYLAAASAVADASELNDQSKRLAAVENAAREPLLTALNAAVSAYEAESDRKLKRWHQALAAAALAVLTIAAAGLATLRKDTGVA